MTPRVKAGVRALALAAAVLVAAPASAAIVTFEDFALGASFWGGTVVESPTGGHALQLPTTPVASGFYQAVTGSGTFVQQPSGERLYSDLTALDVFTQEVWRYGGFLTLRTNPGFTVPGEWVTIVPTGLTPNPGPRSGTGPLTFQKFGDGLVLVDNINFTEVLRPAVPEPATWVTMILGFGMVGAALRRRLRQVAAG